jgi:hypothetical protein
MRFTYEQTEPADGPCGELWTCGEYGPDGEWIAESDHGSEAEAKDRADALNRDVDDVMRPLPGHRVPDIFVADMR